MKSDVSKIYNLCELVLKRILLVLLGIIFSEIIVRHFGYQPFAEDPTIRLKSESYSERDSIIGWVPNYQPNKRLHAGKIYHQETILPNRTRLVTGTSSLTEAKKIIILGDSSIFGWGLSDEDTFASKLSLKVPQFNIINAAVPGYGALQSYLWMQKLNINKNVKAVILGYTEHLLLRDIGSFNWANYISDINGRGNFYLPYAELKNHSLHINQSSDYFRELPLRNYLSIVRILESVIPAIKAKLRERDAVTITEKIFEQWALSVRKKGAEPMILFWDNDQSANIYENYLTNIKVKSLRCKHPNQGKPETLLPKDGHPSSLATRYWAECVSKYL